MVATDLARGLSDEEETSFRQALVGHPIDLPCTPLPDAQDVEGVLLGGCLSLLAATLGSSFEADLSDALLFLEDVNEPLYRVDRMLTQLELSGSLKNVKAMILGHLELTDPNLSEPLPDLLKETAWGAATLVATGLPCGHGVPNLTVPIGVLARLAPSEGRLQLRLSRQGEGRC
jgi:muramoyltetrapeptide carboxypeptidase